MSEARWTTEGDDWLRCDGDYFNRSNAGLMTNGEWRALVAAVRDADRLSTLRRLAYELAHGNRPQLFEGRLHWYSPERADDEDVECPTCHGETGGWVRVGGDDWDWSPCDACRGAGCIPGHTDENGRPHFLNAPLTDAEVAEWEALEAGE